MKRIFDLIISGLGLFILSPLIFFLIILVRIKLGSPVFFNQIRPGLNEKPFKILKFRSMLYRYDESGHLLPDAQRLTPFGKFLRASSLDELPGLWNVLEGSMSMVGPRPLLVEYILHYNAEQARRHEIRPGITGWAQINGRNAISWEDKFEFDVWYVDNQSFWLDLKILFCTIKKVFVREGISARGEVAMPKFKGSNL